VKVEKTPSKAQHRHLNKRQDEKNAVTAGGKYRRSRYGIPSQQVGFTVAASSLSSDCPTRNPSNASGPWS